jgi:hypothetical protein
MANKFQKSVLDRQEAEEKRRKDTAPQEAPDMPPDIRAYLTPGTQRVAKNKTFYLDEAVVDAVKRVAREQQVTESRLVNDILRNVFSLPA